MSEPVRHDSWRYENTENIEIPVELLNILDTTYFNDGIHCIDYVLLYIKSHLSSNNELEKVRHAYRKRFEECLKKKGLLLETTIKEHETDAYNFVKIHLPKKILLEYAEELQFKFPVKYQTLDGDANDDAQKKINCISRFFYNYEQFPLKPRLYKAYYSEKRKFLFDTKRDDLLMPRHRSFIVQYILEQEKYGHRKIDFGLQRLLAERAYEAAYALHDGDLSQEESMRYKLNKHWASVRKWYQFQPLDYIKDYFGTKIALYFAWLEFYTLMLSIAALIGIICVILSGITMTTSAETLFSCAATNVSMCPNCDTCNPYPLDNSCFMRKLSYLVDNPITVIFAMFMSLWSVVCLEFWKRRQAKIQYKWNISDLCALEQPSRPEYHIKAGVEYGDLKISSKKGSKDRPNISFRKKKLPARVFSGATILFLLLLATAATFSIIIYRIYTTWALSQISTSANYARIVSMLTSAVINLVFIVIFNFLYNKLAEKLTDLELHRTQVEYDDALALKMYILKFVNYYSTLFYIAFFKSNMLGFPRNYFRLFGLRQEECSNGGCLYELTIQLVIIFALKQIVNTILEMMVPIVKNWYKKRGNKISDGKERWFNDFKLQDYRSGALIPEYMEMVIQFGFVTLFSFAFPLAPFLALINNVFELRFDAKKIVKYSRRPINEDVKDIGIWFGILNTIVRISVIVNGLIIAFTSDFIPKLVFLSLYSTDGTLKNYVNFTLSSIEPQDYDGNIKLNETCHYFGFREHKPPYDYREVHYTILLWRLIFVIVFENILFCLIMIINWCIPDTPQSVKLKMNREKRFLDEIFLKREQNLKSQPTRGTDNFSFYESLEKQKHHKSNEVVEMQEFPIVDENFDEIELKPQPFTEEVEKSTDEIENIPIFRKPSEDFLADEFRFTVLESNLNQLTKDLTESLMETHPE